jgi:hypothetical protein
VRHHKFAGQPLGVGFNRRRDMGDITNGKRMKYRLIPMSAAVTVC